MSISVRHACSALAGSGACGGSAVGADRRRGGGGGGACPGATICVGWADSGAESGSMVMASELSSTLGSGVALSGIGIGVVGTERRGGGGGPDGVGRGDAATGFFVGGGGADTRRSMVRAPESSTAGGPPVPEGMGGGTEVLRSRAPSGRDVGAGDAVER